MASGKSSVGRLLASKRSLVFIDTDDLIVETHGSIEQIFATRGEDAFREMERAVAKDLEAREGLVIATGGRMMLDQYCADALSSNGHVFCLSASIQEIQRLMVEGGAKRNHERVGKCRNCSRRKMCPQSLV